MKKIFLVTLSLIGSVGLCALLLKGGQNEDIENSAHANPTERVAHLQGRERASSAEIAASAFTATQAGVTDYKFVGQMIDSSDNGYLHSYGPSIIVENGIFHMFYCSTGTSNGSFDSIRYATSPDGRMWTPPTIILSVTDMVGERAACDPSVVKYQAPTDTKPYYYLFYSGNESNVQTVMFVARSENIDGPYAKWTMDNQWVEGAPNPKKIIGPLVAKPNESPWYGAGQQTVVVRNGRLESWYTDDTSCAASCTKIYASSTEIPTAWPPGQEINIQGIGSVDVKYDSMLGKYAMFYVGPRRGHEQDAYLARRYSDDGMIWGEEEVICSATCFPDWSNNPGVSGDVSGHLIDGRALIVYGAPFDLSQQYSNALCDSAPSLEPYCWGRWDLYASAINPRGAVWNEIPWGWSWLGMNSQHRLALGDYDGDGKTDRAIAQKDSTTDEWSWYVIDSSGSSSIPWGWSWLGMNSQHRLALGDYDGDGKTDRAIAQKDPATGEWSWYVIGSSGSSPVPWGWKSPVLGDDHELALGDYDGDGKTDRAIVNTATMQWYVIGSSGSSPVPWGWSWLGMNSQHRLALGDYDGDGKTDRAIAQKDSTTDEWSWYVIDSSGSSSIPWGWSWLGMNSQHRLALGDYDGDGKTDRAIAQKDPATGEWSWYVIGSSGSSPVPWGWKSPVLGGDHELALGDYDGDGKTDRAILDRGTNRWYVVPTKAFEIY